MYRNRIALPWIGIHNTIGNCQWVLQNNYSPTAGYKCPNGFSFLPTFDVILLVSLSGSKIASHCGFNLHFSDKNWCWAQRHLPCHCLFDLQYLSYKKVCKYFWFIFRVSSISVLEFSYHGNIGFLLFPLYLPSSSFTVDFSVKFGLEGELLSQFCSSRLPCNHCSLLAPWKIMI